MDTNSTHTIALLVIGNTPNAASHQPFVLTVIGGVLAAAVGILTEKYKEMCSKKKEIGNTLFLLKVCFDKINVFLDCLQTNPHQTDLIKISFKVFCHHLKLIEDSTPRYLTTLDEELAKEVHNNYHLILSRKPQISALIERIENAGLPDDMSIENEMQRRLLREIVGETNPLINTIEKTLKEIDKRIQKNNLQLWKQPWDT